MDWVLVVAGGGCVKDCILDDVKLTGKLHCCVCGCNCSYRKAGAVNH